MCTLYYQRHCHRTKSMSIQSRQDCTCLQQPAPHTLVNVALANSAAGKPSELVAAVSVVLLLQPVVTAAAAAVGMPLLKTLTETGLTACNVH